MGGRLSQNREGEVSHPAGILFCSRPMENTGRFGQAVWRKKKKIVLLVTGGARPRQRLWVRGGPGFLPPLECPFGMTDS